MTIKVEAFKLFGKQSVSIRTRPHKVEIQVANVFADDEYTEMLYMTAEELTLIAQAIAEASKTAWKNITPKVAQSDAADWYAYYDKEFDNEGDFNLPLRNMINLKTASDEEKSESISFTISRPSLETSRCFVFNKAMMQDYLSEYENAEEIYEESDALVQEAGISGEID